MTEPSQETPTTPETTPHVVPPEPVEPAAPPEPTVEEGGPTSPEAEDLSPSITLDSAQYDEYQEVKQAYDNIVGDDKAMALLRDYYEGKNMEPQETPPLGPQDALAAKIQQLEENQTKLAESFQSASQHIANLAVTEFENKNPDFTKHRSKVGQIMGEYPGISLDRALALARAEAGESPNSSSPPPVVRPQKPAVETTSEASLSRGDPSQDEIQAAILSKETTMDKAIDLAIQEAQRQG